MDQHRPVPNMCAISSDLYSSLRSSLSADLRIISPLPLAAIRVGCKLLRVAHTPVATLVEVPEHISSRRVWVQVANSLRPEQEFSPESIEVIGMSRDLASSPQPQPFKSLFFRPLLVCEALADACADSASAGLGGFVRLPDGRQACFAQKLSAACLTCSPDSRLALLPSIALPPGRCWLRSLFSILSQLLPPGHTPFHVVFRTDNSPSQSAAWKGLTLARGMCQFLRQFCLLQETVRISSVPGFLNDTADCSACYTWLSAIRGVVRAVDSFPTFRISRISLCPLLWKVMSHLLST